MLSPFFPDLICLNLGLNLGFCLGDQKMFKNVLEQHFPSTVFHLSV